jgi:hypothetical protein
MLSLVVLVVCAVVLGVRGGPCTEREIRNARLQRGNAKCPEPTAECAANVRPQLTTESSCCPDCKLTPSAVLAGVQALAAACATATAKIEKCKNDIAGKLLPACFSEEHGGGAELNLTTCCFTCMVKPVCTAEQYRAAAASIPTLRVCGTNEKTVFDNTAAACTFNCKSQQVANLQSTLQAATDKAKAFLQNCDAAKVKSCLADASVCESRDQYNCNAASDMCCCSCRPPTACPSAEERVACFRQANSSNLPDCDIDKGVFPTAVGETCCPTCIWRRPRNADSGCNCPAGKICAWKHEGAGLSNGKGTRACLRRRLIKAVIKKNFDRISNLSEEELTAYVKGVIESFCAQSNAPAACTDQNVQDKINSIVARIKDKANKEVEIEVPQDEEPTNTTVIATGRRKRAADPTAMDIVTASFNQGSEGQGFEASVSQETVTAPENSRAATQVVVNALVGLVLVIVALVF